MTDDVGMEPLGVIVARIVNELAVSPAVTPTAVLGADISAHSDTTVCYPGSLWSAFTAACPHLWRSRQDTRPSVATGLPDDSNGALREAAMKRLATDAGRGASVAAALARGSRAHHDGPGAAVVVVNLEERRGGRTRPLSNCNIKTVMGDTITPETVRLGYARAKLG